MDALGIPVNFWTAGGVLAAAVVYARYVHWCLMPGRGLRWLRGCQHRAFEEENRWMVERKKFRAEQERAAQKLLKGGS